MILSLEDRKRRLRFRATHRGTKEADIVVGGFMEAGIERWGEGEVEWFEALMHEQDADILAWAIGKAAPPERFGGPLMDAMRRLDYIAVAR